MAPANKVIAVRNSGNRRQMIADDFSPRDGDSDGVTQVSGIFSDKKHGPETSLAGTLVKDRAIPARLGARLDANERRTFAELP